jgi:hypothetical protein
MDELAVGNIGKPFYGAAFATDPELRDIIRVQRNVRNILKNRSWLIGLGDEKNVAALSRLIVSTVSASILNILEDQAEKFIKLHLSEAKVALPKKELTKLIESYKIGSRFKGRTLKQRLHRINKDIELEIRKIFSDVSLKNKELEISNYMTGRYRGASAFRPLSRLAVSEVSRLRQETAPFVGDRLKKLGMKVKYEWVLSTLPGRKYDICDVYAKKRFFTRESLPAYPHPFCYCKVRLVVA